MMRGDTNPVAKMVSRSYLLEQHLRNYVKMDDEQMSSFLAGSRAATQEQHE